MRVIPSDYDTGRGVPPALCHPLRTTRRGAQSAAWSTRTTRPILTSQKGDVIEVSSASTRTRVKRQTWTFTAARRDGVGARGDPGAALGLAGRHVPLPVPGRCG